MKTTSFAIIASFTLLATPSFASETDKGPTASVEADGYGYRFKDDALAAGGLNATDPRLHVVQHAARSVLIRPRTQFIQEMLKSVENL